MQFHLNFLCPPRQIGLKNWYGDELVKGELVWGRLGRGELVWGRVGMGMSWYGDELVWGRVGMGRVGMGSNWFDAS